MQIFEIVLLKF